MSDCTLYKVDFDIVEDWGLRKGEAVAHIPEWMVEVERGEMRTHGYWQQRWLRISRRLTRRRPVL